MPGTRLETIQLQEAAPRGAARSSDSGGGAPEERYRLHCAPFAPRASQQLLLGGYGVDWLHLALASSSSVRSPGHWAG